MNFYSDFTKTQSIRAQSFSVLKYLSVNKVNEIFVQTFVICFEGPDQKLECVKELEGGDYWQAALHAHEWQSPLFWVEEKEN